MPTHWEFAFIGILLSLFKGVQCTVCSDAARSKSIAVIKMCQSGSIDTQRVVIDTYGTGDPDVHSCTCTARPYKTANDSVTFGRSYIVDQVQKCDSTLSVQSSRSDSISFECVWPDVVFRKEWKSFDVILSRTTSGKPWNYGYCILLDTGAWIWNVSCLPPVKSTTVAPIIMTLDQTTTTTSSPSTKTPPTLSTTNSMSSISATSSSNAPESTSKQNCSPQTAEVFSTATVVVPIVVVVLIAAVTTIANVILHRRRLALDKKPENKDHVLQPSVSVVYDSIDVDRLEPPHTYADTTAGRMYANTANGTNEGRMYENTTVSNTVSKP